MAAGPTGRNSQGRTTTGGLQSAPESESRGKAFAGEGARATLLADAELLDDAFVAIGIVLLQVVEQATALADEHEQAAARAVVFFVRLEVLRQLTDALTQQCDLDFGATGVGSVGRIPVNEGSLLLSG